MLTLLREYLANKIELIALIFAKIGVKPLYLTISSLIFSFTAFITLYYYNSITLYVVFILLSGFMDMVDGSLARLTGQVSRFGAFLDSTIDRFSDVLMIYPLVKLGYRIEYIVYLIIVSLMISYVRARGESLNIRVEGVGIIERAERILLILLIAITFSINTLLSRLIFYTLLFLSTITLIQRIVFVTRKLKI